MQCNREMQPLEPTRAPHSLNLRLSASASTSAFTTHSSLSVRVLQLTGEVHCEHKLLQVKSSIAIAVAQFPNLGELRLTQARFGEHRAAVHNKRRSGVRHGAEAQDVLRPGLVGIRWSSQAAYKALSRDTPLAPRCVCSTV